MARALVSTCSLVLLFALCAAADTIPLRSGSVYGMQQQCNPTESICPPPGFDNTKTLSINGQLPLGWAATLTGNDWSCCGVGLNGDPGAYDQLYLTGPSTAELVDVQLQFPSGTDLGSIGMYLDDAEDGSTTPTPSLANCVDCLTYQPGSGLLDLSFTWDGPVNFYVTGGTPETLTVATPEPSSLAMLLAGLGLLAICCARRRRMAAAH